MHLLVEKKNSSTLIQLETRVLINQELAMNETINLE